MSKYMYLLVKEIQQQMSAGFVDNHTGIGSQFVGKLKNFVTDLGNIIYSLYHKLL